jgi:hypothetical protein
MKTSQGLLAKFDIVHKLTVCLQNVGLSEDTLFALKKLFFRKFISCLKFTLSTRTSKCTQMNVFVDFYEV